MDGFAFIEGFSGVSRSVLGQEAYVLGEIRI